MLKIENGFRVKEISACSIMQNIIPDGFLSGITDNFEAVFVKSGSLTVTVGERIFECRSGTAVIFEPDVLHCVKLSKNEYTEYIFFSFKAEYDFEFEIEFPVVQLSVFQKQLLLTATDMIAEAGEYNNVLPKTVTVNSLTQVKLAAAIELLMLELKENNSYINGLTSQNAVNFKSAVAEMQKAVLSKLSVDELAENLGVSLSYLKRLFSSYCNVGAHEYYMQLKIIEAKRMLKNGISVTETALLAGFNNQNYFSAAFKRITGVLPKEYCSKLKNQAVKIKADTVKAAPQKQKPSNNLDMPSYLL